MSTIDIIGFVGISIILIAYLLILTNIISSKGFTYIFMNFIGAGIACYASILLKYVPFIILEAVWTAISLIALLNIFKAKLKLPK
ncbi:MAG: hypothetical protein PF485_00570 [Bacteroidales bacterium]|jgi:hypothetical protein|nr:hypothetical protein [Bacteroidales bacterium]